MKLLLFALNILEKELPFERRKKYGRKIAVHASKGNAHILLLQAFDIYNDIYSDKYLDLILKKS
jgi:hypothetical protein